MVDLSVTRDLHVERLNAVVNDPSVRPWVGAPGGALDMTAAVADPRNVLLMGEGGGFLFVQHEPGIYEIHSQFVQGARGRNVLQAAADAQFWMFTRTDCERIVTRVPDGNVAAEALTRRHGGEFMFHRDNAWLGSSGLVGCRYYAKTYEQWVRGEDRLIVIGHEFHERLEAAKIAKGATTVIHEDDEAHDRYVGATCEMIRRGLIDKGIALYNRWARLAGYETIALIAVNPPVIDIRDALIAV
jgi:hypothetical protein